MNRFASTLLFSVAAVQCAVGAAAEPPKGHRAVQPPGMYRIDWEARAEGGAPRQGAAPVVLEGKIDGLSGDAMQRSRANGKVNEYAEKGAKQLTQCVQTGSPTLDAAAKASCPDHTVRVVDEQTLSYVSNCPTMQSTRTVKRIDDKTWQIDTALKMIGNPSFSFPSATVRQRWTRVAESCS